MSGNDISSHEFYRRALPEELRREFEEAATAMDSPLPESRRFVRLAYRALKFPAGRAAVPWNPRIDPELCTKCGICAEFCPKSVFDLKDDGEHATVARPAACVFLCKGCVPKCPVGAISFPTRESILDYVARGQVTFTAGVREADG